jgi:hypothetical protein
MTMPVQQQAYTVDTAVTRNDVMRLLEEVGSPEKLDVSGQNLQGITLMNFNLRGSNLSQARICEANLCGANLSEADLCEAQLIWADLRQADLSGACLDKTDLRGADLSWASLGGASTFELTRGQLRRRGAIFREKTNVIVAERFSDKAGRTALGFALGLPCMSVVGFLMGLGIRIIFTRMQLKRYPANGAPCQVGSSPGSRS